MQFSKVRGYILAGIAAATYGTNPGFAVPLYDEGINPNSLLLFRYLLGLPLVFILLKIRGRSLRLHAGEIFPVFVLGVLMGLSSYTLFRSYQYMNSGIASTLLFVYPVLVALIMILFYKEKFKVSTALCLIIMGVGVVLLMHGGDGQSVSSLGIVLVLISALTYALCLVMMSVSRNVKNQSTLKLLFYMLLSGSFVFMVIMWLGTPLTVPHGVGQWTCVMALAFFPTVISLVCTTLAVQSVGSTVTAIFGALEPVTAVVLSVVVLGQGLTPREVVGGVLIVIATTLVVVSEDVDRVILRVRKMFPSMRRR